MKYHIITYGCQMNKSDSERIAATLENIGYQLASRENKADLIIVNMCSVRQSAVDRIFGLTQKFAKLKSQKSGYPQGGCKTILTGCVSQKDFEKFKNSFDYILAIKALSQWPALLKKEKCFYYPNPRDEKFAEEFEAEYLKEKSKPSKNFSVFVPISTGCNNFCSFCIVPYVRGPLICRAHEEILEEAKEAIKNGAKEIWLLGQNVNRYRSKSKIKNQKSKIINFAELIRMINDVPGDFWIRFTSPHPADFSDELIETMAKCQKFAPYLNLPIQSGDNEILKKMNRPYTIEQYKNLVKKIRERFAKIRGKFVPISISTDAIVGFPGESKKQFENAVKLFKEITYDMAYIAKYSPRPGTAAAKLKNDVSPEEKERRYKILTEILKETALEKNKKYIGKEVEVLVDSKKDNSYFGKTRTYKTVKINLTPKTSGTRRAGVKPNLVGQFVKVKIINALPWGLGGILIKKS